MTHTYLKFYLIALRLFTTIKNLMLPQKFADECRDLYESVVKIQENLNELQHQLLIEYSNEPYQIWVGSGCVWGEIQFILLLCILEEMQWMRTQESIHSDFLWCGTLNWWKKMFLCS